MASEALHRHQITVYFDTSAIGSPGGPITIAKGPVSPVIPPPLKELLIPQGISIIVFAVVTLNQGDGPEAQFPTYPIEWFVNNGGPYNTPVAQPDCFQVHWYNPRQVTVVDTNSALFENRHPFNVVVAYENQTYGTDPTIINQPPTT
ncbi:MAG TPA: hypothetical protein VGH73_25025 [Thermoanaerobaculia bacterium]|jgi:hypothetical protein